MNPQRGPPAISIPASPPSPPLCPEGRVLTTVPLAGRTEPECGAPEGYSSFWTLPTGLGRTRRLGVRTLGQRSRPVVMPI